MTEMLCECFHFTGLDMGGDMMELHEWAQSMKKQLYSELSLSLTFERKLKQEEVGIPSQKIE